MMKGPPERAPAAGQNRMTSDGGVSPTARRGSRQLAKLAASRPDIMAAATASPEASCRWNALGFTDGGLLIGEAP